MKETVPDFLANLPAATREITLGLREVVKAIMPEAHEFIHYHFLNYGTSESSNDRFCYIAPFTSHVNLGFMFGKIWRTLRVSSKARASGCATSRCAIRKRFRIPSFAGSSGMRGPALPRRWRR